MPARQAASFAAQACRAICRPTLAQANPLHPLSALRSRNSSSSSSRWLTRQSSDPHTRAAALSALKSRAAFKLLEIHSQYHLFRAGQSVVDLGYAPGSWSQVAKSRVGKYGKVVGIDVIPAQPPRGVSALQGDFLSEGVQARMRSFVRDGAAGGVDEVGEFAKLAEEQGDVVGVVDRARHGLDSSAEARSHQVEMRKESLRAEDAREGRVVDVVLSDMMMNTSGNPFRDHAGSMDLCLAALTFAHDCLVTGGHFLCKYYQGAEEKSFEIKLKKLFGKVHRVKPASSRKESREAYFLGLRRKTGVTKAEVFGEG